MRHVVVSIALCAGALVLGCSKSEEAKAPPPAAPDVAEPVSAAPGAAPMPAENKGFDYSCADGVSFSAKIDKGNALVTIDGKTSTLAPVQGALGAQYAGEGLTFIARGDEATLVREGESPRSCKAKS